MPRWRFVLAVAAACIAAAGCGFGARTASNLATTPQPTAAANRSFPIPTAAVTRTPTPEVTLSRPPSRLGRCAGSVCEAGPRERSAAGDPFRAFTENWSDDFSKVVWESLLPGSARCDERRALHVAEGGGASVVVGSVGRNEREGRAVWSPDGSMLAIEDPAPGCGIGQPEGIVVFRADGSAGWRVAEVEFAANGAPARWHHGPSWSPGGTELVFVSEVLPRSGANRSYLSFARFDGSARREVTLERLEVVQASWLRGGAVALLAYRMPELSQPPQDPGPPPELYLVDADGRALRRLTEGGAYVDADGRRPLVVSPDGGCIAYRRDNYAAALGELRVTCVDGASFVVVRERMSATLEPFGRYTWLTDGRLAVPSSPACPGLEAVRVRTDERECLAP